MAKVYFPTLADIEKAGIEPETLQSQNHARNLLDIRTPDKLKHALRFGYTPAVERAESYIEKIEGALQALPDTSQFEVLRSPFGTRLNLGEYLAGSPTPMRRKVKHSSDVAPVKIVVGNFVSYGVKAEDYARRSEAIIALVMLVQRFRPVDLFCSIESMELDDKNPVFGLLHLESRPICLSEVGFIIGHPAFSRIWGFSWLQSKGVEHCIPYPSSPIPEKRKLLGLESQDIYINSLGLYDPLKTDPLGWILEQMKRLTGSESD